MSFDNLFTRSNNFSNNLSNTSSNNPANNFTNTPTNNSTNSFQSTSSHNGPATGIMTNERYAAVFKALLDNQGIPNQVGQIPGVGGEAPTYVIEMTSKIPTGRTFKIDCCFMPNSPVLCMSPQIAQVPNNKRAAVLEALNTVHEQILHTRFVITADGWLESRSWSIFIAFEEEDFTGDVAMEIIELYHEMKEVFEDHMEFILSALR